MNSVLKAVAAMVLVVFVAVSCNKSEEIDNGGDDVGQNDSIVDHSGSIDGRDYVDLGLPSGTLWAACNVGANMPEDCGEYFAWGDTAPKEMYDWKSYRFACFVGGRYELSKYCTDSNYGFDGFVDSLTVLEPVDDAVRANWGADWRMPTKEEFDELFQNTTYVWTARNGVDGRLLTGSNGNSIFLPATGFCLDGEYICPGLGVYWSSSLQTSCQVAAWSFHFNFEDCHVCGTYERSRGQCVRAVRSITLERPVR